MPLQAILVKNEKHIKEFLEFPSRLYSSNESYIRPLDKDIEEVFDDKKNPFFKNGQCQRFLFINEKQETLGKVAVFFTESYLQEIPTGGFGFFDCVNDDQVAHFIFDFCKNWLISKGLKAMDGPINFGERDKFWGLLIDGFSSPIYGMNYNPVYYESFFKNYGFEVLYKQLCFTRIIDHELPRLYTVLHQKHKNNPKISIQRLVKSKLSQFAKDFTIIYNAAWATHTGGKQITEQKALQIFHSMKPIINEHICWFVYHEKTPIAMWVNIPDLNQWFNDFNGKLGIKQKIKFLWKKSFSQNSTMVGLVFGVVPEWQNKGIDCYMVLEGTNHIKKNTHFKKVELQWIGDFNPKMIKIAHHLQSTHTRTLATYRFLFH